MVPMLGREVEESEQSVLVLGQAGDRLLVFGAVFVGEHVDGGLGGRAGRCSVNLSKVCLHVDLDREGDYFRLRKTLIEKSKCHVVPPPPESEKRPTRSVPRLIPPKVLEPVRRQGRVDGGTGGGPMTTERRGLRTARGGAGPVPARL
jgi:hypothetical protein